MMRPHLAHLALCGTLLGVLACTKEYSGPIPLDRLWSCHQRIVSDSATLAKALVGRWVWDHTRCAELGDKNVALPNYYGVTLTFRDNQQVEIMPPFGGRLQRSTWRLVKRDDGLYGLEFTPAFAEIPQGLRGRILMCEPNVYFDEAYVDGCGSFFIRQQ